MRISKVQVFGYSLGVFVCVAVSVRATPASSTLPTATSSSTAFPPVAASSSPVKSGESQLTLQDSPKANSPGANSEVVLELGVAPALAYYRYRELSGTQKANESHPAEITTFDVAALWNRTLSAGGYISAGGYTKTDGVIRSTGSGGLRVAWYNHRLLPMLVASRFGVDTWRIEENRPNTPVYRQIIGYVAGLDLGFRLVSPAAKQSGATVDLFAIGSIAFAEIEKDTAGTRNTSAYMLTAGLGVRIGYDLVLDLH